MLRLSFTRTLPLGTRTYNALVAYRVAYSHSFGGKIGEELDDYEMLNFATHPGIEKKVEDEFSLDYNRLWVIVSSSMRSTPWGGAIYELPSISDIGRAILVPSELLNSPAANERDWLKKLIDERKPVYTFELCVSSVAYVLGCYFKTTKIQQTGLPVAFESVTIATLDGIKSATYFTFQPPPRTALESVFASEEIGASDGK